MNYICFMKIPLFILHPFLLPSHLLAFTPFFLPPLLQYQSLRVQRIGYSRTEPFVKISTHPIPDRRRDIHHRHAPFNIVTFV